MHASDYRAGNSGGNRRIDPLSRVLFREPNLAIRIRIGPVILGHGLHKPVQTYIIDFQTIGILDASARTPHTDCGK